MSRVNIKLIARKISRSKALETKMERRAKEKLETAKNTMIKEFIDHPVSQEISAGAGATNLSGTLSAGSGNLFTFIGFPAGARPIQSIISLIQRKTFLLGRGRRIKSSKPEVVTKLYTINYLDETELNLSLIHI